MYSCKLLWCITQLSVTGTSVVLLYRTTNSDDDDVDDDDETLEWNLAYDKFPH